jgi:hypothetical protein
MYVYSDFIVAIFFTEFFPNFKIDFVLIGDTR